MVQSHQLNHVDLEVQVDRLDHLDLRVLSLLKDRMGLMDQMDLADRRDLEDRVLLCLQSHQLVL
jgi:hypothetical protein